MMTKTNRYPARPLVADVHRDYDTTLQLSEIPAETSIDLDALKDPKS